MLNRKVAGFIESEKLLYGNRKYLVALSGGADSVALLMVLKELGYDVEAVHCNFHLRGKESDRDEVFCRELCERHGLAFHVVHFDTHLYAELHKVSIEMAARELRYGYFERLREDIGADGICVAHHKDDSVETILMNLVRGTGIHGLTGIAPRNGHVVRPLLCVDRKEITDYLNSLGQEYVTDSTNLVDEFVRNKIRLNVLPLLREINPAVSENVIKMAGRLREAEKVLEDAFQKSGLSQENADSIDIKELKKQPSPEYFLFRLLGNKGFTPAQIEQITECLDTQTGKEWVAPCGTRLLIDRGKILIDEGKPAETKPLKIPECGVYVYGSSIKIRLLLSDVNDKFVIPKDKNRICLDADKVRMPLVLRTIRQGDRFVPFGMTGSKLVSDFLTNLKKTLFEKRRQTVLVDADDNILWVVNERSDNRYRITRNTRKALIVSTEETLRHA